MLLLGVGGCSGATNGGAPFGCSTRSRYGGASDRIAGANY